MTYVRSDCSKVNGANVRVVDDYINITKIQFAIIKLRSAIPERKQNNGQNIITSGTNMLCCLYTHINNFIKSLNYNCCH